MTTLTVPAFANVHSHVFHRALRGRTQQGAGSFWTWREQMYALAMRLTPDLYFELSRAVYAEMAAAGIGAVGEFHYLHHRPDGGRYDDPNEMGKALLAAADEVGIRIRLLDTCYLTAGIGLPAEGVQRRFSDGTAEAWAERVSAFADHRVGAAIHSVRAVPREDMAVVAAWAETRPLHVHLSEQPAENDECQAAYGLTPTAVLADAGALGPMTTVVHATHLTDDDVRLLRECFVCMCPTTERDLADGLGRASDLRDAGARVTLGSDSHAVIDLFEEMRGVEMHDRLRTGVRGHWSATSLLDCATTHGLAALDLPAAGTVELNTASPRTAGTGADEHTAVYAATGADVTAVEVNGRVIFDGDHERVGRDLDAVIERLWA